MAFKDILLDNNLDIIIENGDFKVSDSDQQHIELICNTAIGNWKQYPLLGIGIINYVASSGQSEVLKRLMNVQLASDGFKINEVSVTGSNEIFNYSIDAER